MIYDYYSPAGGLPSQKEALQDSAIFTDAYVYIPKRVLTDIVTSFLYFPTGKNKALGFGSPDDGLCPRLSRII